MNEPQSYVDKSTDADAVADALVELALQKEERRKILVIDDNPSIHDDFQKVLAEMEDDSVLNEIESDLFGESTPSTVEISYEIFDAFQGQEGLELVQIAIKEGRPFDMAFVDMRMPPGWDGLETIENLWKADPDLQIVICSAYSDYPLSEIRRRLGITDKLLILKKPFENSEVCQLAATLTEKRRLARRANLRMSELENLVEERTNELRRLSNVDVLTNLLNRRGLLEQIEALSQDPRQACVLTLDIDSFKSVNDQFGHRAGDEVLKTVSDYIGRIVRKSDISGRIGGDEFVAVLSGAGLENGQQIAERIRMSIAEHVFSFDGQGVRISVSIGIALGKGDHCWTALLDRSDTALYQAKSEGRNVTRIHPSSDESGDLQ